MLLDHCAGAAAGACDVYDAVTRASNREFQWTVDAGLGPLLLHVLHELKTDLPAPRHDVLHAADLTARVLHDTRKEATVLLLEACAREGIVVTLLKGISTSEELYPLGHLRRMSDVDVLVRRDLQPVVEALAQSLGFRHGPDDPRETLQHGVPMRHRELGVWLEVHRSLFPSNSALSNGVCFSADNLTRQARTTSFEGLPVARLSPAMQLVYTASYWVWDLGLDGIQPGGVMALVDGALLLKRFAHELDWTQPPDWLDNDIARGALQMMVRSIRPDRYDVDVVRPAAACWRIGSLQALGMKLTVDRHLLGGRPWTWPIQPPVPGRYNLRRQLAKRLSASSARALDW